MGRKPSWSVIDNNTFIKPLLSSITTDAVTVIDKSLLSLWDVLHLECAKKQYITIILLGERYQTYIQRSGSLNGTTRLFFREPHIKEYILKYKGKDVYLRLERVKKHTYKLSVINPHEIENEVFDDTIAIESRKEGKKKVYYTTKYERNPQNRLEAIRIHGLICQACEFDFEKFYGELGKDFIEVHHIKPLHSNNEEVNVDPKEDLVCLCPNCHRMMHRLLRRNNGKIMNPNDLKKFINQNKKK
ncbi:MAG: HNH endonuclease [Paludibacteraceae bacterium]|nr:HNH endonuclease [Paludibacteraceae bacterium]